MTATTTSPARHGLNKAVRTVLQLVAGGALTALIAALVSGLAPGSTALWMGLWTTVVAFAQNTLEAKGTIPTILPSATVAVAPPVTTDGGAGGS